MLNNLCMRFMYPYSTKRMLAPWRWAWRDRILVLGETLAFGAAVAAIPIELLKWHFAPWLLIGATVAGTAALLWYAFDLISLGERPLTNRSAHNVRQVVSAMEMEKEGAVFDWENIDQRGGIPSDLSSWSRLRPDLRAIMEQHDVPLVVAARLLSDGETDGRERDS